MLSFALLLAAVVATAMMPGVRGVVRWLDPSLVSSDVPPDGGTRRDAPWGDAATAFGALEPGDTLRVLAGHYNSQLRVLASGNAQNWITVEAETLGAVTFDVQASCCIFCGCGCCWGSGGVGDNFAAGYGAHIANCRVPIMQYA